MKETFDIRVVARPVRDGLHHDEVLRRGKGDANPRHVSRRPALNRLKVERQRAEGKINVDAAGLMAKQQDPRPAREVEGIGDSRPEGPAGRRVEERGPFFLVEPQDRVNVPSRAGATQ